MDNKKRRTVYEYCCVFSISQSILHEIFVGNTLGRISFSARSTPELFIRLYKKITPVSDSLSLWCARRELNPQNYEPESYTYANSVTRANENIISQQMLKHNILHDAHFCFDILPQTFCKTLQFICFFIFYSFLSVYYALNS